MPDEYIGIYTSNLGWKTFRFPWLWRAKLHSNKQKRQDCSVHNILDILDNGVIYTWSGGRTSAIMWKNI